MISFSSIVDLRAYLSAQLAITRRAHGIDRDSLDRRVRDSPPLCNIKVTRPKADQIGNKTEA